MLKYFNKIFQIFIDILIFIITFFVFISIYNVVASKVFNKKVNGITMFEIVSGSMEPTINVKDLIVVLKTDLIKENDIITYSDGKDYITHRVIKIDGDNITAKGDSNNSVDTKINKSRVIGKVILIIPKGGIIREIILTPKVIISIIVTLFLFSLCISYVPKEKREKIEVIDLREPIEFVDLKRRK